MQQQQQEMLQKIALPNVVWSNAHCLIKSPSNNANNRCIKKQLQLKRKRSNINQIFHKNNFFTLIGLFAACSVLPFVYSQSASQNTRNRQRCSRAPTAELRRTCLMVNFI